MPEVGSEMMSVLVFVLQIQGVPESAVELLSFVILVRPEADIVFESVSSRRMSLSLLLTLSITVQLHDAPPRVPKFELTIFELPEALVVPVLSVVLVPSVSSKSLVVSPVVLVLPLLPRLAGEARCLPVPTPPVSAIVSSSF